MAVTKGFGADVVRAALAAGLVDLGENYAQELVAKADELGGGRAPAPRWHFVGRLQRNKVRKAGAATWRCGRASTGRRWGPRSPGGRRAPRCSCQVNVTGEPQKGGCAPADGCRGWSTACATWASTCGG